MDTIDQLKAVPIKTLTTNRDDDAEVTYWLTATIGVPHLLADALGTSPQTLVLIDAESTSRQTTEFFRAPAQLTLPQAGTHRVGVAALVLRPDRQTSHLAVAGMHEWPGDRDAAIRSLERLIQAHAGQWMPQRALWPAPAEVLMPDEIY
ncbi:MAG TPA: hypothetical protein VEX37_03000 [Thermomicrobiales bacterium]|nr:hypothetical protein [Thermomicrobiales bacterium]